MAAYDTLRAAIDNYIKANGNKEITGTVLNDILNAMVSALGADTRFAGVAVPSTNPGNPEGNVVYFASQAGTYSNFGGIVLPLGIHILVWNGTAWTSQTWFSVDNTPTQNSQNLATSGGILQAIVDAVGVERLRAIGVEVTSCSFDGTTKKISFFNSANTTLFQLDATAFVIDGMVSDVKIEDGNLVIQFNTDAGKQDIEIPLTDIFNPANYYTKTAIDTLLALYYTKTEVDGLLSTINTKLADGYLYKGIATPTTSPATPATKEFYLATIAGTYTNFGNIVVKEGITILKYDGTNWTGEQLTYTDGVFDISAYNGTSYADLSAALGTDGTNIPQNLRKGGMSVKFVQSSDNKYVRYNLLADSFTIDTTQWAIDDNGVYIESPEFVKIYVDSQDRILWAIKADGDIYFGAGVPTQVKDYIQARLEKFDKYDDIVTFLGNLIEGDTLATLLSGKVNVVEGKGLSTNDYDNEAKEIVDANEFVDNQEFLEVVKDSEDTLLESTKPSGKKKFYAGIEVDGVAELDNVTANNIAAKSIEFYTVEERESFLDYLNISSAINAPRYIGLKDIAAYRTSNDKYRSFDLAFKISEFLNSPIVLKIRARYIKTAETDNIPTITIYQEKELGSEVHFKSQIYEIGKEGNDYSIREYRIILPPPECTYFHLVVDVPENIELHISDFSSSYKEGMMNSNVSHLVDCHGIVGKFCALSDVERCVINGFNSCIVVPKKTSDGVWCCFHDDDNINGLSYPNGQKVCVKDGNTYTQYDEQGNVIGSSAMPVSSLTWAFLSTLNYRAATFDRTYVETIDDFLEVCVKTGVSPVFSIHPNWSSSDKAWFKSRLIQYGLLNKAVFIIQAGWLSSYYEVFGDNIGGYCIFPTATTLAGVQETIGLLANYNTQNGKYWIEMIYANMGDDVTAQSLVSEINNSTKTVDGNTVPTGIKVCVFATGQNSSVLRKLILWGVNRIGTNMLYSYGLNW